MADLRKTIKNVHTISFLVANKPGVLVRIASVFARRGFNIDSLVVSPTVDPRFSRMTITAQGNPETLDQIIKQAAKLIDVLHAGEHKSDASVERELALFKLRAEASTKAEIEKIIKIFHAHVVDTSDNTLVIEQTGTCDDLDKMEIALKRYGIIELARTGKIILARGKEAT